MSMLPFELIAASVQGREHVRTGRNNQDAWCVRGSEHGLVAVVADGCGSQPCSELGAQLGARRVAHAALERLATGARVDEDSFLPGLREDVLCLLGELRKDLGRDVLADCLFTLVGAVVTPAHTLVFAAGDGVWALNGELHPLGPFPGNAPPYLTYALLNDVDTALTSLALVATEDVHALLLGTDGVADLAKLADTALPSGEERVGPLSQFWTQDRYFANPDALRRRLALLNRESVRADFDARRLVRSPGLLADDTTLVVLRRRMGRA
ncbi:protein phosphatase 2C domain-containing protein [Myxococcus sp. K15C18031901]|uniref:protein phosphatase 2C domain-containing protein n=1 Tax=Myxococcus dinghuensis TaxID=2906761 RepID=UPI0020A75022|nr:protein phosphatase 2C domain-containing protein [Myxococcus dinghuensis]MCP3102613.1 protein phosphatase 2C domain-containing protein [Myxococcus dinghuensis]